MNTPRGEPASFRSPSLPLAALERRRSGSDSPLSPGKKEKLKC